MNWSMSKGLLVGSMIGAALSLLDKQTRTHSFQHIRDWKTSVSDLESVTTSLNSTSEKIKETAVKISDDAFFVIEKLEELKGISPVVAGIIRDTKDAFYASGTKQQERKLVSSIQYLPEAE